MSLQALLYFLEERMRGTYSSDERDLGLGGGGGNIKGRLAMVLVVESNV